MVKKTILLFILAFWSGSAYAEQVEIKTSSGRLNIRKSPGFNSSVCNSIRSGQKFEKLQERNGWIEIKVNHRKCPSKVWIHAYYTKEHYRGEISLEQLKSWQPQAQSTASNDDHSIIAEDHVLPILTVGGTHNGDGGGELAIGSSAASGVANSPVSIDPNLPERPHGLTDEEYNLCQFYDTERKILDSSKIKNCYKVVQQAKDGKLPYKALMYSLKYLKANLGEFKDDRCLAKGAPKGIKNSCQFLLNDLNKRVSKSLQNRSPSYFIDLCDGTENSSKKGLVYKTYINRGTGSSGNSYADRGGRKTTVPGAFITGALTPFIPYRVTKAYRNLGWANCFQKNSKGQPIVSRPIKNMSQCPVTRLALYGAHNSNNSTSASKPMHVSPYQSSWGCPSVSADNRWIMEELNKRGPSMVINYGPEKYHKDSSINNCRND